MNADADPGTLAGRIALLVGNASVNAFASRCGFSESLLRKYLAGSIPGADKLVAMARAAGMSVEWLATGEGPMRADDRVASPVPASTSRQMPEPSRIDEDLHGRVVEGIARVHGEEGARLAPRHLGQIAARIHGDLLAAYDAPEERPVGLKLALEQLRRELRMSPPGETPSKRPA